MVDEEKKSKQPALAPTAKTVGHFPKSMEISRTHNPPPPRATKALIFTDLQWLHYVLG